MLRAARAQLAAGARELVLVGQDTSRWAQPGWGGMSRLLGELAALEPAPAWLRLLYLQPDGVTDELLEALAAHAVPYVDVPLQHASGAVLRRMRRSGDGDAHLALLARVRAALPGAAVRSTFITGFPGETEAEFEELEDFVRDAGLAVAGVFVYDEQEGTAASGMPGAVLARTRPRAGGPPRRAHRPRGRALLAGPRRQHGRRPRRARHLAARRCGQRARRPAGPGRRRTHRGHRRTRTQR